MDAPDLHKLARIQLDANKERAMRPPISQYTPCPYQETLYADNEWEHEKNRSCGHLILQEVWLRSVPKL